MQIPGRALVALYLRERAASPEEAATTLLPAFAALQRAGLQEFFPKARSRKLAEPHPFVPSVAAIATLLARGVNRRDMDGSVMPELGLAMSLWSGGVSDEAFSLSVHVGSTSPYARNCFLLELPSSGPYALHRQPDRVKTLFAELTEILSPSQGVVCAANAIAWEGSSLSADIPALVRYANAA